MEVITMIDILRKPDDIRILCEEENIDAKVKAELVGEELQVTLSATKSEPKFVVLRWNDKVREPIQVLGDKWERACADLEWRSLGGENFMPWYFLAHNGSETVGCGVMVQPNSFVSFQYDASGVTAWFDVRCGAKGVQLKGRNLLIGRVVCKHYKNISAYAAARDFCKVMCPAPLLPKEPVYGSNNWYYAYGKSSYEEIVADATLLAELTKENKNRPFMVIDDGWSPNATCGPWIPNEAYGDMKKVADAFKELNVKPGIWIRFLYDLDALEKNPEWGLPWVDAKGRTTLDPSHPGVKAYLRELVQRLKGWGYQLVKHDFSTRDMLGYYGFQINGAITPPGDWAFYDRSKTSAEIVLDFYRLLREEAGDEMMILGCNTVPHLCAGLVELNRTGDDTSGRSWSRTRSFGLNTLAFRLCQNGTFYAADADCVGILEDKIDWKLNRQWLDLLARSGTALFVSMQPSAVTDEMKEDLKKAFAVNSIQKDEAEPLDWFYNKEPHQWLINGEKVEYDFVMDSYPALPVAPTNFWKTIEC